MVKLIKTAALTAAHKRDLGRLEDACKNGADAPVRFPLEDADLTFLLYETTPPARLAAALFLIMPQIPDSNDAAECIAYTHPALRRRGYFSRLFEAAETEISETDLLFPVCRGGRGTLKALEALGAEFSHAEYRMDLSLPGRGPLSGGGLFAVSRPQAAAGLQASPPPQSRNRDAPHICAVTQEATDVSWKRRGRRLPYHTLWDVCLPLRLIRPARPAPQGDRKPGPLPCPGISRPGRRAPRLPPRFRR